MVAKSSVPKPKVDVVVKRVDGPSDFSETHKEHNRRERLMNVDRSVPRYLRSETTSRPK